MREKSGRYTLLREPLYLDRCIVCTEADWEDYFELQEISSKETFIFKVCVCVGVGVCDAVGLMNNAFNFATDTRRQRTALAPSNGTRSCSITRRAWAPGVSDATRSPTL